MQLDLVSLRYFVAIANLKSFRKAAAQLNITQPALSRRVQMLEDALKVPLLMRHGRGVTPTAAGELLRQRAETILRLEAQIQNDVLSTSTTPAGHLRVATPPAIAKLVFGKVVTRFLEEYPKVSWTLSEGFSDDVQRRLLEDKVDLGIMTRGLEHPDLLYEPLYDEQLCLIFSKGMGRSFKGRVTVEQVGKLPIMAAPVILEILNKHLARRCTAKVELNAVSAIPDLIAGGNVYFVGQRSQFWDEIRTGRFQSRDIEGVVVHRCLVTRADRPISLAGSLLVARIREAVIEIIAWPESPFMPPGAG